MFKKLRTRLFGFKKADVYSYITEMDETATEQLLEKDEEIRSLKEKLDACEEKIADLEKNKDAIVSALMLAEQKAKDLVSDARKEAEEIREAAKKDVAEMREIAEREISEQKETASCEIKEQRETAEREISEQKTTVNREIENKRKEINSYYETENKKIDRIKNEVDRMRQASIEAINNLERQLREVERMSENNSSYIDSAKEYALTDSVPGGFDDIDRKIPVHIVESFSE